MSSDVNKIVPPPPPPPLPPPVPTLPEPVPEVEAEEPTAQAPAKGKKRGPTLQEDIASAIHSLRLDISTFGGTLAQVAVLGRDIKNRADELLKRLKELK